MQNRTVDRHNRQLHNTTEAGIQKANADERILADQIAADATSQAPAAKTLPNEESVGVPLKQRK